MILNVGDKAVYPSYGVGTVKAIEHRMVDGAPKIMYKFEIDDSSMSITIPQENMNTVGVREIIPSSQVKQVYEILEEKNIKIMSKAWNRRQKEYSEKIRSGSIYQIAEVLRELHLIQRYKKLSYGEKKIYEVAKKSVVREVAAAKSISSEAANSEISTIIA